MITYIIDKHLVLRSYRASEMMSELDAQWNFNSIYAFLVLESTTKGIN